MGAPADRSRGVFAHSTVLFVSILVLVLLAGAGERVRRADALGTLNASGPLDAYSQITRGAAMGRTLVCLCGRSLSVPIDDGPLMPYAGFPVVPSDLPPLYTDSIDEANTLFALMQEGVIRRIIYGVPEAEWGRISQRITGTPNAAMPIDMSYRGSRILLYTTAGLPQLNERVILYVDGPMADDDISRHIDARGIEYDLKVIVGG